MKRVKNIAVLLLCLLLAEGALAQRREKTVVYTDSTTVVTTVRTVPNFTPKHDIRVGVGSLSLPSISMLDSGSGYYDYGFRPDFRQDMAEADTFRTPRYFVGNYSLSYTYHDRRWLQYGGTVIFGASTCWRKDSATGAKLENLSYYSLSIMPTVRFNWFYRDAVQLYSTISAGVVTDFDEAFVWGDITLVGCSFGRKLFGFAELGCGMGGWLRAGLGYRFNAGNNKK